MSQVVYLTVRVVLEDEVDVQDFVENCDYDVKYNGVVSTEITEAQPLADL